MKPLFGKPQPEKYHPEIDSGVHTLMVLAQAKQLAKQAENPTALLFAALCHDLGKSLTPEEILPHQLRARSQRHSADKKFSKPLKSTERGQGFCNFGD